MGYRQDLWEVAADNHGIVTLEQAEDAGVPAQEVRKLAARGALERVGYGTYRHLSVPADEYTAYTAALASIGDDAFLTGDSVLALLNLADADPPNITIGVRRRYRRQLPPWIHLESRSDVPAEDVTATQGVAIHSVLAALMEAIERHPKDRIHQAAIEAEQRGLITDDELQQVHQRTVAR